jgi:predicted RNA-binding protein with PIN domain
MKVALEDALLKIHSLEERASEAKREVKLLKTQATDARRHSDEMVKRRTEELTEDLARSRQRVIELERRLADKSRETDYWEKEANAAWDDLDEADRRYHDLRERYSSKTKSAVALSESKNQREVGFSRDPLEVARMIDQMVSFWEVGWDLGLRHSEPADALVVPAGFDPKSADALQWIFFEAPRLNLIVDGWNVAHSWHKHQRIVGKPDGRTKELITNKLDKLVRYSVGRHRVSLYLDSRHESSLDPDWGSQFKGARLTGYYVADADDAIVKEVAARAGMAVVVITSDNGLAERCHRHGALRVYSEALTQWMADSPV